MFDSLDALAKRRAERKKQRKLEEDSTQKAAWLDPTTYEPLPTEDEEEYEKMLAESKANRKRMKGMFGGR